MEIKGANRTFAELYYSCTSFPHMNSRAFKIVCYTIPTFWKDKYKEENITLSWTMLNHGSVK